MFVQASKLCKPSFLGVSLLSIILFGVVSCGQSEQVKKKHLLQPFLFMKLR
jgi:hypothetical protein